MQRCVNPSFNATISVQTLGSDALQQAPDAAKANEC